jgi:hypothetical protein
VHLPAVVTNRGARDAWNIAIATPPDRLWSWTLYRDDNANGVKDPTENLVLPDSDADGTRDTGTIEPDGSLAFVAVTTLPSSETLGQVDVTLTAVSVAQPDAPSASAQVLDRVLVQAAGCASSCGDRTWFLRNALSTGHTVQQQNMPMDLAAPGTATLFNYDTDRDSSPGRLLLKGGSGGAETDHNKMAKWQRVAAEDTSFSGEVVIRFYAAIKDFKANTKGELIAYVRSQDTNGAWTERGNGTFQLDKWGGDFREAKLRVPVTFAVAAGRRIEVKVINGNSSGNDLWVAYDTTSYPAKATFPAVAP